MEKRAFVEIGGSAYVFVFWDTWEMIDSSSFCTKVGLEEAERHFAVISRRDESVERGVVGELEAEIVINDGFVVFGFE